MVKMSVLKVKVCSLGFSQWIVQLWSSTTSTLTGSTYWGGSTVATLQSGGTLGAP